MMVVNDDVISVLCDQLRALHKKNRELEERIEVLKRRVDAKAPDDIKRTIRNSGSSRPCAEAKDTYEMEESERGA
jgi:hypothetical protein